MVRGRGDGSGVIHLGAVAGPVAEEGIGQVGPRRAAEIQRVGGGAAHDHNLVVGFHDAVQHRIAQGGEAHGGASRDRDVAAGRGTTADLAIGNGFKIEETTDVGGAVVVGAGASQPHHPATGDPEAIRAGQRGGDFDAAAARRVVVGDRGLGTGEGEDVRAADGQDAVLGPVADEVANGAREPPMVRMLFWGQLRMRWPMVRAESTAMVRLPLVVI